MKVLYRTTVGGFSKSLPYLPLRFRIFESIRSFHRLNNFISNICMCETVQRFQFIRESK